MESLRFLKRYRKYLNPLGLNRNNIDRKAQNRPNHFIIMATNRNTARIIILKGSDCMCNEEDKKMQTAAQKMSTSQSPLS